ncbi:MAG: D-alanine--D-alanine ligase [Candidatus Gygaella obscura]|nr:D-alanine--D-alanine ligase [Candidatus Gygaella obscura]
MEKLNKLKIAVLMGGVSSEREISLKSADAVCQALGSLGLSVVRIDIDSKEESDIRTKIKDARSDFVFIALHGGMGEDGSIQAIIESLGIAYTGSGVQASALAMDKLISRKIFKDNGLEVPGYVLIKDRQYDPIGTIEEFGFPIVVKPVSQGSSVGLHIVDEINSLNSAIQDAFLFDSEVLLEKYIKGRELTVGILNERALTIVEIKPKSRFFDFNAKYGCQQTDYIVPAVLTEKLAEKIKHDALLAHNSLNCRGFSRVDMILDYDGKPIILEVNTIPGLTSTSLLPKAAKSQGIDFPQLCLKIIETSLYNDKNRQKQSL